jgi:D-amino-acid dehydrogenase
MSKHVVVIGAGVVGLSAALYCARRGHRVTLVERWPQRRDGCSFGNAGMIVPSHFTPLAAPGVVWQGIQWMRDPRSPFYVKPRWDRELFAWGWRFWRSATRRHVERCAPVLCDLNLSGRACYAELAAENDDFGFVERGLLMLCNTAEAFEHEVETARQAESLGIPAEVCLPGRLAELEPNIRIDATGGVYYARDCHLTPNLLMAALQRRAEAAGVRFLWESEAVGWRIVGRQLVAVNTTQGEVVADEFVLCGGAWSPRAVQGLRLSLPMQAGKGYSVTLDRPRQLPRTCAILVEARVAVTPMGEQLRFGGTMAIAGMDESIDPRRVQGIIAAAARYYPEFRGEDFAGVRPWSGLRPCSPDGMPYLGRTRRYRNLIVATGHAMMGLSLGAISGKIVADLTSDERPPFELAQLCPDRFT